MEEQRNAFSELRMGFTKGACAKLSPLYAPYQDVPVSLGFKQTVRVWLIQLLAFFFFHRQESVFDQVNTGVSFSQNKNYPLREEPQERMQSTLEFLTSRKVGRSRASSRGRRSRCSKPSSATDKFLRLAWATRGSVLG